MEGRRSSRCWGGCRDGGSLATVSRTAMKYLLGNLKILSIPLHLRSSNQPFVFLETQKAKTSDAKCLAGLAIKLVIRQLSHWFLKFLSLFYKTLHGLAPDDFSVMLLVYEPGRPLRWSGSARHGWNKSIWWCCLQSLGCRSRKVREELQILILSD